MTIAKIFTASILALCVSQVVHADPVEIGAMSLLKEYNLITLGDVTSTSEVEGNALIGGNVNGGQYNMRSTSNASVASLTVAGNTTGNIITKGKGLNVGGDVSGNITMNDGGDAYVQSVSGALTNNANGNGSTSVVGYISGTVNTNGGKTTVGGVTPPVNAATEVSNAAAVLSSFSNQLAAAGSNSSFEITGGKVTFNATADSNGLAVFAIDNAASFFENAHEFAFNVGDATSILFNVSGALDSTLNLHANFLAGFAPNHGDKLLWNFLDAKSINILAQFGGSVLALGADVTTDANIEGTLVSKSLNQNAEIHSKPSSFIPPPISAVPVPPALFLFAPALLGFMGLRRKAGIVKAA
ncbi:MAG TPA: choice-of-anchor A family protein [Methylophaga aminisulfidivorans]|uniref:Choice-of-anchor A family protein n=2 Tax=root TaxID=1 RepID=A0A7C2A949_9GAMM|nr:choice-of-anchor A family protein [Methylophaga aminisulfidivorans]